MEFQEIFVFFIVICEISGHSKRFRRECGRKIVGENEIDRNKWTWLVGFVYQPYDEFFCSGHLISELHVLTAAHCFRNKFEPIAKSTRYVRAFLSNHNLKDRESNERSVSKFVLHPEWNTLDFKAHADIAVVVLTDSLTPGEFQPICLPPATHNDISGAFGSIVGWRNSRPNNLFISKSSKCIATFPEIKDIITEHNFCGMFKSESNFKCLSDSLNESANGFYIQDSTEVWRIQGILSQSLERCHDNEASETQSSKLSLYTNVGKFVYWIEKVMKETREIDWKFVIFNCTKDSIVVATFCYSFYRDSVTENLKILPNFSQHQSIKSADVVSDLVIDFEPSNFIYGELGEVFCNLKTLRIIWQSIKFVERSNFANMEYLQELSLFRNPIEFFPEDVFWDLHAVEELNLCDCQIKKLPETILKHLKKLTSIILSDNFLTNLPGKLFENNLKLQEISLENNRLVRIEVDFTKLRNLKWVSLEDNKCINMSLQWNDYNQLEELQEKVSENR